MAGIGEWRSSGSWRGFALLGLSLLAVCAAYANHFHNSFHFDDGHAVVSNVYIRDLRNFPRFFTDASTFSSLPANQTWRPIVTLSLAIDYRLGGGLDPFFFHLSTFLWFLVQLGLMYLLYRLLMDAAAPRASNRELAVFAVLCYGLHPVVAETVNYVIQRADLYATLGVVAGLLLYARFPKARRLGLYLLPVVLGAMSKATAVVFGAVLFAYVFLFEEEADPRRLVPALVRALPALVASAVLAAMNVLLTAKSYLPSMLPAGRYWATQPYVLMRYVRSLFLPLWLSADTDLPAVSGFADPRAVAGALFCLVLLAVGAWAVRERPRRPIAFGVFWYFAASAPTSLFVLSEVENDHRMYMPFVGLVLSVVWGVGLAVRSRLERQPHQRGRLTTGVRVAGAMLLLALAAGTFRRNQVWRSEESLFYDVTLKSPENGRGLMNYGLSQMTKGNTREALEYFLRAAKFTPNYPTLEINLGVAYGALGQPQDAEAHFQRALALAPADAQPYFYFGRWLAERGRRSEAIQALRTAIDKNRPWMEPRHVLMNLYARDGLAPELKRLAQETLEIAPADAEASRHLTASAAMPDPVAGALRAVKAEETAESYLSLSLAYHRSGRFREAIEAARQALRLRPGYAEAYNNIAAAHEDLREWDAAIDAARQAVKLKPDFELAKNNLAYAESQKRLQGR